MWKKYLKQFSLPESFISITLGFLVVVVAGLLIYNYLSKNKPFGTPVKETQTEEKATAKIELPTTHKVAANETLWSIAEKYYNSGYNWVTIASENNLTNPDYITVDQTLSIPKAEIIRLPGEISAAAAEVKTYTVVAGDSLWNIAVREYGDGYAWTRIAKENNLVNPNLIHPGNVLRLTK
jgi:nucleoid-associated protein YgaU